ncbi:tRNA (5-methylaminomethyl-2-thiouridylate)-methyltransferase [Pneumocystis murina B123]|uniref:tRNA-5-taurinomethyluridine 2-sulfurtransferase n=1 Tax=Pneumocystis murina (strain B123) TaxID=1069680 RepID=M7NRB0_PNEMU|nr:tRNA (5-methylaminomethyl-2-thiouridylate)-methyltransferase [Pneumocystis murina B123]EMR09661.1 tRNA (5-methylaminomethyl-2-thiouridylate)-methyltransferase [Pneumocystis murina B123]
MSGGVDSSVAAALLKSKGLDVVGIFIRNWIEDNSFCSFEKDFLDVQRVSKVLSMPEPYYVDFSRDYWNFVFQPALDSYKNGYTPNPDVNCNRYIKFGSLFEKIEQIIQEKYSNCNKWWVATGHYATVKTHIPTSSSHLLRSKDMNKDQCLYLSRVSQSSLRRTLFPLSNFTKPEVRKIAKKFSLPTADKKESQGLCFVSPNAGRHFSNFLANYLNPQKLTYIDISTGDILSVSFDKGIWNTTIGESSRIYIPQAKNKINGKWFVADKNPSKGIIYLCRGWDNPALMKNIIYCKSWHWIDSSLEEYGEVIGQLRHRQKPQKCYISRYKNNMIKIEFEKMQRGIAPGQNVAVWKDKVCLGGGVIHQVE